MKAICIEKHILNFDLFPDEQYMLSHAGVVALSHSSQPSVDHKGKQLIDLQPSRTHTAIPFPLSVHYSINYMR